MISFLAILGVACCGVAGALVGRGHLRVGYPLGAVGGVLVGLAVAL